MEVCLQLIGSVSENFIFNLTFSLLPFPCFYLVWLCGETQRRHRMRAMT